MHRLLSFCLGCSFVVGCYARPGPPGCVSVSCKAPGCIDLYTPPNQCCPICRSTTVSGCIVDGVQYMQGATVTYPCQVCWCSNGMFLCTIYSCSPCKGVQGDIPPCQCCPSCDLGPKERR